MIFSFFSRNIFLFLHTLFRFWKVSLSLPMLIRIYVSYLPPSVKTLSKYWMFCPYLILVSLIHSSYPGMFVLLTNIGLEMMFNPFFSLFHCYLLEEFLQLLFCLSPHNQLYILRLWLWPPVMNPLTILILYHNKSGETS